VIKKEAIRVGSGFHYEDEGGMGYVAKKENRLWSSQVGKKHTVN